MYADSGSRRFSAIHFRLTAAVTPRFTMGWRDKFSVLLPPSIYPVVEDQSEWRYAMKHWRYMRVTK
jgi:hypothetical protein